MFHVRLNGMIFHAGPDPYEVSVYVKSDVPSTALLEAIDQLLEKATGFGYNPVGQRTRFLSFELEVDYVKT